MYRSLLKTQGSKIEGNWRPQRFEYTKLDWLLIRRELTKTISIQKIQVSNFNRGEA